MSSWIFAYHYQSGFSCSTKEPMSCSCCLYTVSHPSSNQVSLRLYPILVKSKMVSTEICIHDASSDTSLSFSSMTHTWLLHTAFSFTLSTIAFATAPKGSLKSIPEYRIRGTYPHLFCSTATKSNGIQDTLWRLRMSRSVIRTNSWRRRMNRSVIRTNRLRKCWQRLRI